MNTNTETMNPAGVLAVMDEAIRHAEERGHMIRSDNMQSARAAVDAMIERNAELERQNDEILARNVDLDKAMGALEAERDALRTALVALRDAGPNGATAFAGWHPAYADATRLAIEALSIGEASKPEGGAA